MFSDATSYGKTECHIQVRMIEHFGVSAHVREKVKEDDDSAIKECNLFSNYSFGLCNLSLLANNNNDFDVTSR